MKCIQCNNELLGRTDKIYCDNKCRRKYKGLPKTRKKAISYKKDKLYRRVWARIGKPAISKYFKKEITDFYWNKPNGLIVDHIIPLNNPKVSGLHVPWNLQYLTSSDNTKKSNSFDGTRENNSWKKN